MEPSYRGIKNTAFKNIYDFVLRTQIEISDKAEKWKCFRNTSGKQRLVQEIQPIICLTQVEHSLP